MNTTLLISLCVVGCLVYLILIIKTLRNDRASAAAASAQPDAKPMAAATHLQYSQQSRLTLTGIYNFLKEEGYVPKTDNNNPGWLRFKVSGDWWIIGTFRDWLVVRKDYRIDPGDCNDDFLKAAAKMMDKWAVLKVLVTDGHLAFAVEALCTNEAYLREHFRSIVNLIEEADRIFGEYLQAVRDADGGRPQDGGNGPDQGEGTPYAIGGTPAQA